MKIPLCIGILIGLGANCAALMDRNQQAYRNQQAAGVAPEEAAEHYSAHGLPCKTACARHDNYEYLW